MTVAVKLLPGRQCLQPDEENLRSGRIVYARLSPILIPILFVLMHDSRIVSNSATQPGNNDLSSHMNPAEQVSTHRVELKSVSRIGRHKIDEEMPFPGRPALIGERGASERCELWMLAIV